MLELEDEIKKLIIESLNLEEISYQDIKSEEPLFGEGLGLDSIDALELGVALKKQYGLKIDSHTEDLKKHFFSVRSIAEFINSKVGESK